MRRLSKPWPPSNVSPDGQMPRSFVDAEREFKRVLPSKHDHDRTEFVNSAFNSLDKGKLKEVMHGEQTSLCVYCERKLSKDPGAAHIEHWRPRSRAPEYALHWKNLYLSCETPKTCGKAKGDRRLAWNDTAPDLPWPTERDCNYERLVGFGSDGRIYVRRNVRMDETIRRALKLAIDGHQDVRGPGKKAILNLNQPALVEGRRAALDRERKDIEDYFGDRPPTRGEREEWAARLRRNSRCFPFVSIRVAWVLDELDRGL